MPVPVVPAMRVCMGPPFGWVLWVGWYVGGRISASSGVDAWYSYAILGGVPN